MVDSDHHSSWRFAVPFWVARGERSEPLVFRTFWRRRVHRPQAPAYFAIGLTAPGIAEVRPRSGRLRRGGRRVLPIGFAEMHAHFERQ
jgi:hypothetical protein